MSSNGRVVVVTGCGGMGMAIARRLGTGRQLLLSDVDADALGAAADELMSEGYLVESVVVDVAEDEAVRELAAKASALGPVMDVVHTAGVSPAQTDVERILKVDVVGTARVLEVFSQSIEPGGAGVFVASMAGTMTSLEAPVENRLASTPVGELLSLPELSTIRDGGTAYGVAKRANQVRVRAAAVAWGRRGARVNSVSPGIISTRMGQTELASPIGDIMRGMISASTTGRIGTAADVAAAAEFLLSSAASFISGTDLLVDGGACAGLLAGQADG